MERALFVKRPEEVFHLEEEDVLSSGSPISRIYFGNEFCEALIPSLDALEVCLAASLERGLSFTFVTPQTTDRYLEKLDACFDLLTKASERTEVVVCDWGVLRFLRRQYPGLSPVLGRILNRAPKDRDMSRARNLSYFPYRRFLWNWGVERIEFDCPVQLLGIDLGRTGLHISIYFPHDCCVFGATCDARWGECGRTCRERFRAVDDRNESATTLHVDRLIHQSMTA
jgi:hypothetical protein